MNYLLTEDLFWVRPYGVFGKCCLFNDVFFFIEQFSLASGENYVASECLCLDATLDVASEFTIE